MNHKLHWRDAGVVETSASSHAAMRPVPIHAVEPGDGFWRPRVDANRTAGIESFVRYLNREDQFAPFPAFAAHGDDHDHPDIRRGLEQLDRTFKGHNDHCLQHTWRASILTLMEACAFTLQSSDDSRVRRLLDETVAGIVAAHEHPDFLEAYYGDDFENSYQLATPGHLIQSAIAHHRTTGRREFLDCTANVAKSVLNTFQGREYAEHPCIEMALVELSRATGDEQFLTGARRFLEPLLKQPPIIGPDVGDNDDQRHFNRHVVRQTYLCAGGADYLAESADPAFAQHLDAIWRDMTTGKLHITGNLAVDRWLPERITSEPFDLSQGVFGVLQDHIIRGFEACESVGNGYWNWRMLAATGDAKYADLFERILYNGLLAHVSIDGGAFHYLSPLATDGDFPPRNTWGSPEANCCPPNILRMLASVPGYMFSTSRNAVWVHLYDQCTMNRRINDTTAVTLSIETRYPWDGDIAITVDVDEPATFDLNLRIPGWCVHAAAHVNGEPINEPVRCGAYLTLARRWSPQDRVTLNLSMPILAMRADPRAEHFRGKIALTRGPIVYCFEGADHEGCDVWDIRLPVSDPTASSHDSDQSNPPGQIPGPYHIAGEPPGFTAQFDDNLLAGVTVLTGKSAGKYAGPVKAIPYYAWSNRGPSPMRVWVPQANHHQ